MTTAAQTDFATLLDRARPAAEKAGVFGAVRIEAGRLECEAAASAEPATYRLELDGGKPYVSLVMADRWQSESIEADLMHSGDSLDELLEEELVDQGYDGGTLTFEHFRSDDMLFTFRSPLPIEPAALGSDEAADLAVTCLLAYEACFRQLGDMEAGDDED